ncbi:site-specific integrase [Planctomycetota bacterium]|nr:site-specific integrase [Planctomycetota bacterium]
MPLRKQPNGTYLIEFQLLGERVHRSSGTTSIREARALEDHLRAEVRARTMGDAGGPLERLTLGEAVARYRDTHLGPRARSHRSLYSTSVLLERLQALLGGPQRHLESIGQSDVASLKERLLRDGRSPATVNQYLAYLRAILRRAKDHWGVETGTVRVGLLPLNNKRIRCLTDDEEERLMGALVSRPALRDLVSFLLRTGARLREATRLDWADVDLEQRRITFTTTKNGEARSVPISEGFTAELLERRAGPRGAFQRVNPFYGDGVPPREYRSPHGAFRTACRRAGVGDFRLHDLRHTFASRLVARGVSLYQVSRLLGHRDVRMTQRYAHLSIDDLREAIRSVELRVPDDPL